MKYIIYDKKTKEYFKARFEGGTKNKSEAYGYTEDEAIVILKDNGDSRVDIIRATSKEPKNILIIGDARHGKDAFSDIICEEYGYKAISSSMAALNIFLLDTLKEKHNLSYGSKEEAFEDRKNHRKIWFDEISLYNKGDKTRLAKEILKTNNIYTGMRCGVEVSTCKKDGVFDLIIGVINYRVGSESKNSNTVDIFKNSDIIVCNNGTLEDLKQKAIDLKSLLI